MNWRGLVAMVITEHKKMEACKLVVMGADREQIHEMRIAMMAVLEGLKEDANGDVQVSGFAKQLNSETPPALMQERFLDGLDVMDIADAVLDVVEAEAERGASACGGIILLGARRTP